jgi:prepilin-type N-terminal cleavage/methylation domain-containing protein
MAQYEPISRGSASRPPSGGGESGDVLRSAPPVRRLPRSHRAGFTLIELTIALFIVATLAALALPTYRSMIVKARAAKVVGDFNTVRVAVFNYYADHDAWPPDNYPGIVPPQLVAYLPANFTFNRDGYQLDWENWSLPDGTPTHPGTHVLLGISITTTDTVLAAAIIDLLGRTTAHYTLDDNYTFVIQGV